MKVFSYVFSALCLLSCQAQTYLDNQEEVARIDELPIDQIILEVETDSIGQILDTLSRTYLKLDAKQNKVFRRTLDHQSVKAETITYYRESEGTFYQEVQLLEIQESSYYETLVRTDGRIEKALYIFESGEIRDTQFMEFQYLYRANGAKEQIRITSKSADGEGLNIDNYDTLERLISSVLVLESDTICIEERYYRDSLLQKIVEKALIGNPPLIISYYNDAGKLEEEQSFAKLDQNSKMLKRTRYSYLPDGSLKAKVEEDLIENEKRYFKYITESSPTKQE